MQKIFIEDERLQALATTGLSPFHISGDFTSLVQNTAEQFRFFAEEPLSYKKQWSVDDGQADPDNGFIIRAGETKDDNSTYDEKTVLHYRPHLRGSLEKRGVDTHKHFALLVYLDNLLRYCVEAGIAISRRLDELFPHEHFHLADQVAASNEHVIRLLHYPAVSNLEVKKVEDPMADVHLDRDYLTLSVYESQPGFSAGDSLEYDHNYQLDSLLAFFGIKAEMHTQGKLRAVKHYVRRLTANDRIAIVAFIHIPIPQAAVMEWKKKNNK